MDTALSIEAPTACYLLRPTQSSSALPLLGEGPAVQTRAGAPLVRQLSGVPLHAGAYAGLPGLNLFGGGNVSPSQQWDALPAAVQHICTPSLLSCSAAPPLPLATT